MSKHIFSGNYGSSLHTVIAGAVTVALEAADEEHVAQILDRHANRMRSESDEQFDRLTVRPADSDFDHINWEVIDAEGNEELFGSVDDALEYIDEDLGDDE